MAPQFPQWLLSFFILWSTIRCIFAQPRDNSDDALTDLSKRNTPMLTAITVRPDLQKREEIFVPKQQCEHHYVDHASLLRGANSRFAKTTMKYRLLALTLEDIEENVKEIQCSESSITVQFDYQSTMDHARGAWDSLSEFLIISSHPGCNDDSERAPYLVSGTTYEPDSLIVVFSVARIDWKDAYDSMTVKFGMSEDQYKPDDLRFHDGLRRRQAAASLTASYPSAPSVTPTANVSLHNITYQVPANQEIFSYSNSVDGIQEDVTVNCKDCSIDGAIEITEGELTVSDATTFPTKAKAFIDYGYFKAVANGVIAHVELDTTLSLSNTQSFDTTIATIPLTGFQIPGIASIGPLFKLYITGSIEIIAQLDFTYGFDLSVPDNSSILINIGNITQSSSKGFDDCQIAPIPLTASSPEISLLMDLGLRSELLLAVDILDGDGSVDAGAFLDLPTLSVNISLLTGVNAECDPVSDSSTLDGFLSHVFPNLTNIVPIAGLDVGLEVQAQLNVDEVDIHESIGTQATLAGTQWTLSTVCLSWDSEKTAFASPTVTSTTSTSTGSAGPIATGKSEKGKSSGAGAKGRDNPISGGNTVWWSAVLLLSVLLVSLSL